MTSCSAGRAALGAERLWAVEDCRQLTRWLERQLLGVGRGAGAGAAEADGAGASGRQDAREVGPDRRARDRAGSAAGAGPEPAAAGRAGLSRDLKLLVDHRDDLVDERRRTQQRLRWHLHQLDPTFVVPLRMLGRSSHLERVSRWLARRSRSCRCGSHASSSRAAARSTARSRELDQELEQRAAADRAGAARAARLRRRHRREAARRDRPDRPLQNRRAARPPQRRRTARSKLRTQPTAPTRPRRQPPTQRRALPNRDHASALPPRRPRLPRTQTSRRQEPPRSDPLPQTTPRPRRLQHTQSEPRLDIGATLAQRTGPLTRNYRARSPNAEKALIRTRSGSSVSPGTPCAFSTNETQTGLSTSSSRPAAARASSRSCNRRSERLVVLAVCKLSGITRDVSEQDMREEFPVISHVLPLDLSDYWVAPGQPLDEGR